MNNKYTEPQKKAQKYLSSVRANERRIKTLEIEIQTQQTRLELNGVSEGENVAHSTAGDAMEQGFIQLYDYISKLDTELTNYIDERERALSLLGHISNEAIFSVLYYVYFQGYRFRELPYLLHASERQIYRWHNQGLSVLYRYLPQYLK